VKPYVQLMRGLPSGVMAIWWLTWACAAEAYGHQRLADCCAWRAEKHEARQAHHLGTGPTG
jgi:hypothetical protein